MNGRTDNSDSYLRKVLNVSFLERLGLLDNAPTCRATQNKHSTHPTFNNRVVHTVPFTCTSHAGNTIQFSPGPIACIFVLQKHFNFANSVLWIEGSGLVWLSRLIWETAQSAQIKEGALPNPEDLHMYIGHFAI